MLKRLKDAKIKMDDANDQWRKQSIANIREVYGFSEEFAGLLFDAFTSNKSQLEEPFIPTTVDSTFITPTFCSVRIDPIKIDLIP